MPTQQPEADFESLLQFLSRMRGFDFTAYKRPSLMRRVQKRMEDLKLESFVDYQDYLEVHADEFVHLFNTILINVTSFFRDPDSWEFIQKDVIPQVLEAKTDGAPIRVWTAGCATGEEAYTLAILFAEALGPDQFRSRVKIYATDISENALARGRAGAYSAHEVEGIPKNLLTKYFREHNGSYTFDLDYRRCVIFGCNDLIQDSPISKLDLLVCRNTLMYFNSEVQSRILRRFSFALNPGGLLFLGKAETLLNHSEIFLPVDLKRRVFKKVARVGSANGDTPRRPLAPPLVLDGVASQSQLHTAALHGGPVAQMLIDPAGNVVLINDAARGLFGLTTRDLGRPLQDLTVSYRPLELRARIEEVAGGHRTILVSDVEWHGLSNEPRWFDVAIVPLIGHGGEAAGVSITYTESTQHHRLREELRSVQQEHETAQEELHTTNEELQSTVEELETTNEELQSTNEELETMNEELQSINEELRTSNEELRHRGDQLDRTTGFWQSVLASMTAGMIVIDRDFKVEVWNAKSADLWGLRPDEVVGRHLLNLDIGLPVDDLKSTFKACMNGGQGGHDGHNGHTHDQLVTATNRRGKSIRCKVTCTPLRKAASEIAGVIIITEELDKEPSK